MFTWLRMADMDRDLPNHILCVGLVNQQRLDDAIAAHKPTLTIADSSYKHKPFYKSV